MNDESLTALNALLLRVCAANVALVSVSSKDDVLAVNVVLRAAYFDAMKVAVKVQQGRQRIENLAAAYAMKAYRERMGDQVSPLPPLSTDEADELVQLICQRLQAGQPLF